MIGHFMQAPDWLLKRTAVNVRLRHYNLKTHYICGNKPLHSCH